MNKQLNLFTDIVCDYCGKGAPSPKHPHLWDGFYDRDTKQYVCWHCKAEHYKAKYKTKFRGQYSEMPVVLK